uniref:Uncharacterized protein n=1 Tax=Arundo donax TaxID=35708 RepID=A0A0A9GY37_ARUDO
MPLLAHTESQDVSTGTKHLIMASIV